MNRLLRKKEHSVDRRDIFAANSIFPEAAAIFTAKPLTLDEIKDNACIDLPEPDFRPACIGPSDKLSANELFRCDHNRRCPDGHRHRRELRRIYPYSNWIFTIRTAASGSAILWNSMFEPSRCSMKSLSRTTGGPLTRGSTRPLTFSATRTFTERWRRICRTAAEVRRSALRRRSSA